MKKVFMNLYILLPTVAVLIGLYLLKNGLLAIFLYHIGIIVILASHKKLGLFKDCLKGWKTLIGILFICFTSLTGVIALLMWKIIFKDGLDLRQVLIDYGLNDVTWIIFIIYYCLINPTLEEVFWRSFLNDSKKLISLPDFGFAFYHVVVLFIFAKFYWLFIIYICLVVPAVLWRYIVNKQKGLIIPILSHLTADISIVVAASIMRL